MAVGAYASGLATIEWGLPFWLISLPASLFTAGRQVPFGLPSLRLKGAISPSRHWRRTRSLQEESRSGASFFLDLLATTSCRLPDTYL